MKLSDTFRRVGHVIADHSPVILSGAAVAGLVSTLGLAVHATIKSTRQVDSVEEDLGGKEIVLLVWKNYIPVALVGGATAACIIGAAGINHKRQAALVSVYTITETAFRDYKEKVIEEFGTNKAQKVTDGIAEQNIQRMNTEVVFVGDNNVLCFEPLTSRLFQSNVETIRKAQNDINLQCINEMYASQNDFYRKIGLAPADIGDNVGWNTDRPLSLEFTSVLKDGIPVLAITYTHDPVMNYYKVW